MKFESFLKIHHRLLVLGPEAVVVDVEKVGVGVQVVQPVGVQLPQLFEVRDSLINLSHIVKCNGNLTIFYRPGLTILPFPTCALI